MVDADQVVGHPGGVLGGLRLQLYVSGHGFRPRYQQVEAGRAARVLRVVYPRAATARICAGSGCCLGRDHDRVRTGRCLGAARRVAEQEVLAAYHERLVAALDQVAVERQAAVVQTPSIVLRTFSQPSA